MSVSYTIRQLADEFGVTTRTLRHYEALGLLNPARTGQARKFSARDRARLKVALRSKRLGFTLQEISDLFGLYDGAQREPQQLAEFLARLERKRLALEQQREDLEVMLNEIRFFADQCRRLLEARQGSHPETLRMTLT